MKKPWVVLTVIYFSFGCGGGDGAPADAGPSDARASDSGSTRDSGPRADAGPTLDSGRSPDGGALDTGTMTTPDGGTGGAAFRGAVLFFEPFEDTDFASRGWYDGPSATLSSTEHIAGSTRSFECFFGTGQRVCAGGTPGRHMFTGQRAIYLSYWVKYSTSYVGSGRSYHPHEFLFVTNQDSRWVGPAGTHLTTYVEQVGGVARIALQDSLNVDTACILRNDDSFVGCGGDFASYMFTEMRSVCSCNGVVGDLDGRDCFDFGGGNWYSARTWSSPQRVFRDGPGPYYKNDWHFVEAYFRLNSISGGIGQVDGAIRYWFDGVAVISSDRILLRTGQHPTMAFNQFLVAPYIGDGSPVDQTMWIDDLTVAAGVVP